MMHIADLAKEVLGLPVQTGFPSGFGGILDKVDDPSFSTVLGLVLWEQERREFQTYGLFGLKKLDFFTQGNGETIGKIKGLFKKFLP